MKNASFADKQNMQNEQHSVVCSGYLAHNFLFAKLDLKVKAFTSLLYRRAMRIIIMAAGDPPPLLLHANIFDIKTDSAVVGYCQT